MPPAQI